MKLQTRNVTILLSTVGVLLAVGVGATKVAAIRSSADTGPAVVATVEGKTISAKIYRMYLKNGSEALGLNDKTDEGRRKIELLKEGIISELIDRRLIDAEVSRRNLPVTDKSLAAAYERSVAEMGGEESYRRYLSEHALTDEEFRQTISDEVESQLLRAELDKEVSVTESEVTDFFNTQKNNSSLADIFKQPERVHARHILINARRSQIASEIQSTSSLSKSEVEQRVSAEMAKRNARAAAVLARLKAGADFQQLAAQYSEDQGTKNHGGDLGLFGRNTHTARFDEAAFALKPGHLSDIVETEYGYHVIQVIEHQVERARTLDETRDAIRQRLLSNKRAAHLKAWLEARRREADIYIDPFYRTAELQSSLKTGD